MWLALGSTSRIRFQTGDSISVDDDDGDEVGLELGWMVDTGGGIGGSGHCKGCARGQVND